MILISHARWRTLAATACTALFALATGCGTAGLPRTAAPVGASDGL